SRRRHTRFSRDWSSDVCSSDLVTERSTVMSVTVRPYRRGGFEVDIQWRSQDGRRHRERKRLDITSKTAAQRWGEGRERELLVREIGRASWRERGWTSEVRGVIA